jgi:acyl-CoA thioester hydrolase
MLRWRRAAFSCPWWKHIWNSKGGARYDDLLIIASAVGVFGRARLRFEVQIHQAESRKPVVRGYTVHAFTNRQGKPIRPPAWFLEMLTTAAAGAEGTHA